MLRKPEDERKPLTERNPEGVREPVEREGHI